MTPEPRRLAPVFATLLVAASALSVAGDARGAPPPFTLTVTHHQLSNGMRVTLAPDPALDDVSVAVQYGVGAADDPLGKEGLAHVAQHVMFDGSKHVAPGDHVRLLEEVGGTRIDGLTAVDHTTFYETVPPGRLALALWLEADRMGAPRTPDRATVEHEWTAADAEVDEVRRGRGAEAAFEAAWDEVFPDAHPYHRAVTERSLGMFGPDDVIAFQRAWYTPANAVLVVAGPIDETATLALAETYFGSLPAPAAPEHPPLPAAWKVPDVRVEAEAAILTPFVTMSWLAPAVDHPGDAELDLAATILGGPTGRLHRALVDGGLAVSVSANERSMARASIFTLTTWLERGRTPEAVVAAIDEAIADLGAGPSPAEVESARHTWRQHLLLRVESSASRVRALTSSGALRLSKYDGIDAASVARAVRTTLVPDHRVVTITRVDPKGPWYGVVVHREEHGR